MHSFDGQIESNSQKRGDTKLRSGPYEDNAVWPYSERVIRSQPFDAAFRVSILVNQEFPVVDLSVKRNFIRRRLKPVLVEWREESGIWMFGIRANIARI